MKRLVVYLNGARVGVLDMDDSGLLEFRYDAEWTGKPNAIPLSRSLPRQTEPFRGKHARPFFGGILPDEEPRQQIAAILGISERNDFAMLERIGGECAGAVSLLPEEAPDPAVDEARTRALSESDLEGIVAELPRRPLMAGREGLRLSLAGAQMKLPILIRDVVHCGSAGHPGLSGRIDLQCADRECRRAWQELLDPLPQDRPQACAVL